MSCDGRPVTPADHNMLYEADDIVRAKARRIDHFVAKAMIKEALGEPQRLIDRSRAEAAMLDQIALKISQQYRTRLLRLVQRYRLRNANIKQMLREPTGQTVRQKRSDLLARNLATQLLCQVEGQRRRGNALDIHQVPDFPQDRSVRVDCGGRVILGCTTLGERVQEWLDAGLQILGHDLRAPCCWSKEDYAEWYWRNHFANRAQPDRCGIIRLAAL